MTNAIPDCMPSFDPASFSSHPNTAEIPQFTSFSDLRSRRRFPDLHTGGIFPASRDGKPQVDHTLTLGLRLTQFPGRRKVMEQKGEASRHLKVF